MSDLFKVTDKERARAGRNRNRAGRGTVSSTKSRQRARRGGWSWAPGVFHSGDIAFQGTAMINVGPVPFLRLKRHPSMGWDEEGADEETGRKQGSKVKCQGKGVGGREMQGLNVK